MARDASGIWLGRSCSRECAPPHYGTAWHIDPVTFKRGERFTHIPSDRLAFGDGTLWAYGGEGFHVSRVDQSRVVTYDVPDVSAVYNRPGITTAFGAAWAAGPSGQVFKYTADGGYIRSIQVPPGAYEIAAGGDSLWVIASGGDVTRINPFTLVAKPVQHLGHSAEGIAYLDGRIWIAVGNVAGQG
jgi:hypothetical protein